MLRAVMDTILGPGYVHLVERTPTQEETIRRKAPPNVVRKKLIDLCM